MGWRRGGGREGRLTFAVKVPGETLLASHKKHKRNPHPANALHAHNAHTGTSICVAGSLGRDRRAKTASLPFVIIIIVDRSTLQRETQQHHSPS